MEPLGGSLGGNFLLLLAGPQQFIALRTAERCPMRQPTHLSNVFWLSPAGPLGLVGDLQKVLPGILSDTFRAYLTEHGIQHIAKDVLADNQLGLVDSEIGRIKRRMFQRMAADNEGRDGEPDWHPYFAEAVRWAYENGVTTGTSATTFSPDQLVTRVQFAAFLSRYDSLG